MHEIWLGDAAMAARALCGVGPSRRGWLLRRLMLETRRARLHVARTGTAHPIWGDGSIMAAAMRRHPPSETSLGKGDFRICLISVLRTLDFGKP